MKTEHSAAQNGTYLQLNGAQYDIHAIEAQVCSAWAAAGHRRRSIYRLRVYIKPEEHAVYYVINNHHYGSIPLCAEA